MKDMIGQTLNVNDLAIFNGARIKITKMTSTRIYYVRISYNNENIITGSTHLNDNILKLTDFDNNIVLNKINEFNEKVINYTENKLLTPEQIFEKKQKNKQINDLKKNTMPGSIVKIKYYYYLYIGMVNKKHLYMHMGYHFNSEEITDISNNVSLWNFQEYSSKKRIDLIIGTADNDQINNIIKQLNKIYDNNNDVNINNYITALKALLKK